MDFEILLKQYKNFQKPDLVVLNLFNNCVIMSFLCYKYLNKVIVNWINLKKKELKIAKCFFGFKMLVSL